MPRSVLQSGLRIVTEEVSSVRSATFGIWVNVGSRDEGVATLGASHFLEHLLFKGTKSRSALEISSQIEAVGGEMNAFTSKEYTCFYARVIDKDIDLAIDVISDLITSSLVEPVDVEAEKNVVLEEIAMRDDDPSDLVHDVFLENYYGDSPLGRSILGTVESIKGMSRNIVFNYYRKKYLPQDIVVAVAGNIKHKEIVEKVEKALSRDNFLQGTNRFRLRESKPAPIKGKGKVSIVKRSTEQAHLLYGVGGLSRSDERRFALSVLASALGGGMSSRLFQEIREKRGLAYSTYSYVQQFAGSGSLAFYVGSKPDKGVEVVKIIGEILDDVVNHGLTEEEIIRAKGSVTGTLVLSQEDTGSRMTRIGKSELVYGEIMGFDEILGSINKVTAEDIQDLARTLLKQKPTIAVVGPFNSSAKFEAAIS
jgi:predicted Zn-dependent peptidase